MFVCSIRETIESDSRVSENRWMTIFATLRRFTTRMFREWTEIQREEIGEPIFLSAISINLSYTSMRDAHALFSLSPLPSNGQYLKDHWEHSLFDRSYSCIFIAGCRKRKQTNESLHSSKACLTDCSSSIRLESIGSCHGQFLPMIRRTPRN